MADADIRFTVNDTTKIVDLTVMISARTEQAYMAGRSIDALVQGGDTCRQQLDLGVRDGAVFPRKIAHGC